MINRKKILTIIILFSLFFIFPIKKTEVFAVDTNNDLENNEKDAKEFTLLPLMVNGGNLDYETVVKNIVWDQGYEVHCAHNSWSIKKSVWGDIAAWFGSEEYAGAVTFGGNDPYIIDFNQARIPMFRGMENSLETIKNSSLEGFFGANYQGGDAYDINSSGVAQNLLSSYQQCVVKMQNIDAAVKICNTVNNLAPGSVCALNKEYQLLANPEKNIPTTSFNTRDLQSWFKKLRPELEAEKRNEQVCIDLYSKENLKIDEDSDQINLTRAAINKVPIDLDNLYRLAFLVLVPEQDPNDSKDKFSFLQADINKNEKIHAPIFIAFKIPEFATNKSFAAGNIDSLELTKMILQTEKNNLADIGSQNDRRETLMFETMEAIKMKDKDKTIICEGMPQCKRSNDNVLTNVLVDMINASHPFCEAESLMIPELNSSSEEFELIEKESKTGIIFNQEDLHWEKAGDLFTPASKDLKSYDYQIDLNEYFVNRLLSKTEKEFSWQLVVDQNPPKEGDNIVVNGYLILPIGETVKDANKSMSIFWNENSFLQMIAENALVDMNGKTGAFAKYYTIKGEDSGFKAGGSHSWCELYGVVETVDENGQTITESECLDKKQFGLNFGDTKQDLLIPDFGLGWMIRKIQETIRSTANKTYNYVQSCERVEDLFLGRCSGSNEDQSVATCDGNAFNKIIGMPSSNGVSSLAKEYFNNHVTSRITPENIAAYAAAEEATGIPCEIAAAIHLNEGSMQADKSLFDGFSLRGNDLTADAIAAMQHLVGKIEKLGGSVDNLDYELLVHAIGNYNGLGNLNCSNPNSRWALSGKCPPNFLYDDHAYVLSLIDDRHLEMDNIICNDAVVFNCKEIANPVLLEEAKNNILGFRGNISQEELNKSLNYAKDFCYADSDACKNYSNGNMFPARTGPGAITTAILMHEMVR